MAAEKPNQIQVEIFGQSYAVKAGADPGYVEQLAAYVVEVCPSCSWNHLARTFQLGSG